MGLDSKKHTQGLGPGAGGVGVGTLIIAITRTLPDNSPWKDVLLFSVPSISVVAGVLFAFFLEWLNSKLYMNNFGRNIDHMNKVVEKVRKKSGLSEEQLERIEEERKKAIEKRAFNALESLSREDKGKEETDKSND